MPCLKYVDNPPPNQPNNSTALAKPTEQSVKQIYRGIHIQLVVKQAAMAQTLTKRNPLTTHCVEAWLD